MNSDRHPIVRQAQPGDVEAILDLLTEYALPRSYFEPLYYRDQTYTSGQSWVVTVKGQLAAHLRVFDRQFRVSGTMMRVAGVGNVITADVFRGQGLAGQLLRAAIQGVERDGYAYSLLWTHLPGLYARYGWTPIQQQAFDATLAVAPPGAVDITGFRPDDLADVVDIYASTNAHRSGVTVRDDAYWRSQLAWLGETEGTFLVARRDQHVIGYVRSRRAHTEVDILEVGVPPGEHELGRALLAVASASRQGHLRAQLPPSLADILPADDRDARSELGLMGRTIHLEGLLRALLPVWRERARVAGLDDQALVLATSGGTAEVRIASGVVEARLSDSESDGALNDSELGHLLFHGFDDAAEELLADRSDKTCLQTLFPPQDFVIWPSDAF